MIGEHNNRRKMAKRVFLFGTGADAEQVCLKIRSYGNLYHDKILGFLDNNPAKWGQSIYEYKVFSPDVLKSEDYDSVVICSMNFQAEIRHQLCIDLSVLYDKIIFWRDYLSGINIDCQYQKYLKDHTRNASRDVNNHCLDLTKTTVYTAIEGNCDILRDPEFISDDLRYVCFTDNKDIKSDIWEIHYVEEPNNKNYALDIRKYKSCPQDYLSDSTVTIWVDASFTIKGDLREYVKRYSQGSSILLFPHPERKCIYQECGELISIMKEDPVKLICQAAEYFKAGYPADNGLYAGGVIVRNMHDGELGECMREWWKEIRTKSLRDQQSLPFVLWKNGIYPDICDLNINNNPYFKNNAHRMGHWRQGKV